VAELQWLVALSDPALTRAVGELRRTLHAAGLHDAGEPPAAAIPPARSAHGRGRDHAPASAAGAVVIWTDRPLPAGLSERLLESGQPVVLAGPTIGSGAAAGSLLDAAGLVPGQLTALHDVRVRAGREGGHLAAHVPDHGHSGRAHLGGHTHVRDSVLQVDKTADDVQRLLEANIGLVDHPVATWRPATRLLTWTLGTTPEAVSARGATLLLLLTLRHALSVPTPPPVRVGLLGYGAIGHEHSRAVRAVDGLELVAVCDVSPERRAAAARYAPDARTGTDAERLLAADDVDLVIVSTPPVGHARWAYAALEAGKHVVVEKPFAISTAEADAVLALAAERRLVATVYQNRRFDPDHQAIRRAVRGGAIGDLFHLEAFVGGYGHPCNLWHSDADASGGAFYDWGAHILDQVLDLLPEPIEFVTAAEHKRVWLDVTNADHSRVTVRFEGGAEATFIYSDLAAALKPRWYLLGSRGGIVGNWRTERVISRSDIGTLLEDVLAPADSPPVLDLHAGDGSVTRMACPTAAPYRFHAELADTIRFGLTGTVDGAQARRVLSVMEAATASARDGGRPVVPR
jgi:scyllo-inositol 2-dehydrogenase (NADP+)